MEKLVEFHMPTRAENQPTCFDCQNAHILKGYPATYLEPGWPDEAPCQRSDIPEQVFNDCENDEKELPKVCGHFAPIMAEKCVECGAPINQALYNWPWVGSIPFSDGLVPCCSEQCANDHEMKIQIEEEKAAEAERANQQGPCHGCTRAAKCDGEICDEELERESE